MLHRIPGWLACGAIASVALLCACGSKPAAEGGAPPAQAPAVAKASARAGDTNAAGGAASVTASGSVTTVTGAADQATSPIRFNAGAYVFTWSGTGAFVGITIADAANEPVSVLSLGGANGSDLFAVDNDQVKAGDMKLEVSSDAAWTVKIEKVDGSTAAALPQVLAGEEMKAAMSKPFTLQAGKVTVSYTYKAAPKGTGTIRIVDVATGKAVRVGMMYAGQPSGSLEGSVPAAGVYIAQTRFPLASGGGEVRITQ